MENKQEKNYLPLFDNVEINKEQTILDKDKQRCEEFTRLFAETSNQLSEWYAKFEEASKIDKNEMYYIEQQHQSKRISNKWLRYNSDDDESRYKLKMFSPLFDVLHIEKLHKQLIRMFENDIVSYFNNTYSLRVSNKEVLENTLMGDIPNYMNVVNYILESLGGKTFGEVALQHIIDDFKKTIYRQENIELKNNCLTIKNYMYLESKWTDGYRLHHSSNGKINTVCMAISHFTGSKSRFTPNEIINSWDSGDIDISKPYTLNSDKVDSVRFFKNGRLDIKFVDAQTAQSFYTFFQLNSIGQ